MVSELPLKVFGCTAFVHNHEINRNKLDPKAFKCIFVGYVANQKGYKRYSLEKKKLFVSMDVTFFENKPFFSKDSLQGEIGNEGNFWNISFDTLPSTVFDSVNESNILQISTPDNGNNLEDEPQKEIVIHDSSKPLNQKEQQQLPLQKPIEPLVYSR